MFFLGGPVSVMLVCSLTDHISAASKIPSNIEGGVRIVLLGGTGTSWAGEGLDEFKEPC